MTVGELLRALDRVPGLAQSPLPGSGGGARRAVHGRDARLASCRTRRDLRGTRRTEGERRGVRAAGDRRGRSGHRRGIARACRRQRAVDRRQRRASRARMAVGGVLLSPQPRDERRRHHRHERQDDEQLPGQRDPRCRRNSVRPDGDGHVSHRRSRLRCDENDARGAGSAGLHARHGGRRLRRLRDGGVVARAGAQTRGRHSVRRRGVHESHARSPRLPRRHGGLLRRQAAVVRDAPRRCAGVDQRGRPARRVARRGRQAAGDIRHQQAGRRLARTALVLACRTRLRDPHAAWRRARPVEARRQAERLQHPRRGRHGSRARCAGRGDRRGAASVFRACPVDSKWSPARPTM